jgi:hypothetical protein
MIAQEQLYPIWYNKEYCKVEELYDEERIRVIVELIINDCP